jgi:putative addiction module killer protein
MFTVQLTEGVQEWLSALRDMKGRTAIARRIERMTVGNFGDSKSVGESVSELRVDVGPGYRVYYTRRGNEVVIVLAGGDKSSQDRDIKRAKELAKEC